MSFAPIETSTEDANVIELYTFTFGGSIDRFTSYNRDITFAGFAWQATQISRSSLEASVEDAINELKITVPQDNVIAQQFISNVPGRVGNVQVERGHVDDPAEERVILFEGFIAQVGFDADLVATITCKPQTNVFKRAGPRFTFQGICNHVLYDARCKILRTGDPAGEFLLVGNVTAVSGNSIDVAGVAAAGAGFFDGGFVKAPAGGDDDARLVLSSSGDTLNLLLAFSIDVLATDVDVFAGCTHDLDICLTKFDNVINYGGFPFVPRKNPFNSTLRGGT
jgi:uncharacterized phage protein (TIGR02218 family)